MEDQTAGYRLGLDEAQLDRIAEGVGPAGPAPDQTVAARVMSPSIGGQRADRHQALGTGFGQRDKPAETGHARDTAVDIASASGLSPPAPRSRLVISARWTRRSA